MNNEPENSSPLIERGSRGINGIVARVRIASRQRRAEMFRSMFQLQASSKVLDLGGFNGAHVHSVLSGSAVLPSNVYVADIDAAAVEQAHSRLGYQQVVITESGALPFEDRFFDVVFCSSVLEHVTIPKSLLWTERSGRNFRDAAHIHQTEFASEIRRLGKGYFVQVPNRWFPIETHTWLPFVGYLPRLLQLYVISLSNRFWIKKTLPDFYLPTSAEIEDLFPGFNYCQRAGGWLSKINNCL
jgi:Methyltransferase domain